MIVLQLHHILLLLSVKTDAHLTVALSTPEEFCLSRAIQMFALLLLLLLLLLLRVEG